MTLEAVPMDLDEARQYVVNFHRHNGLPSGQAKFAVGASDGSALVGVAIVSKPVARALNDGATLEVTRVCVVDGAPKGTCSFLYMRCWAAARALGWRKLITYTLQAESGASLRGAGWRIVAQLKPRTSTNWNNRPGREWQPVVGQAKLRWEVTA